MIPIDGMFKIEALPLNSGFSSSAQVLIGRPIRSGLIPNVSALYTVGMSVTHSVGVLEKVEVLGCLDARALCRLARAAAGPRAAVAFVERFDSERLSEFSAK